MESEQERAPKYPNKGAPELRLAMERKKLNQAAVAALCKVGPDEVSRWLSEDRRPSLRSALVLQDKLSVPATLWHTEPPAPADNDDEPQEATGS